MSTIVARAEDASGTGRSDSFADLHLVDLIHGSAISAIKLMEQDRLRKANGNLTSLIERGLVDREIGERLDPSESNAMRYSASCSTQLLDHVTDVMEAVSPYDRLSSRSRS